MWCLAAADYPRWRAPYAGLIGSTATTRRIDAPRAAVYAALCERSIEAIVALAHGAQERSPAGDGGRG